MKRLRMDDDAFSNELGKDGSDVLNAILILKNLSKPAFNKLVYQLNNGATQEERAIALVALASRHLEERREG